jgi:hypothetical protein
MRGVEETWSCHTSEVVLGTRWPYGIANAVDATGPYRMSIGQTGVVYMPEENQKGGLSAEMGDDRCGERSKVGG